MLIPRATARDLKILRAECRRLGGELTVIAKERFAKKFSKDHQLVGCSLSPVASGLGCTWTTKHIYVLKGSSPSVNAIIHEMGHVFASLVPPDEKGCKEEDFLGWEIALALKRGYYRLWSLGNYDYGLHGFKVGNVSASGDWGHLNAKTKSSLARELLTFSRDVGMIRDEVPVAIR